ncbi:ABC transporter family protein [Trichomonas vaginalis G3]|uniref:ABC transporter family protein n=1 Tax=Trichomonas vaginalis (strain ATCC PRA-98 / G3) TaxID=412133 RepID=A2FBV4_TRIV3|nr:ATP-binding cassette sub-family B family [Trichomonas vaginalis G3]EAX97600.1 ABC transporter family protein [Trichomonas vaginalis G3]KAI5510586.1 ATP-binding cassette sub-family B family [Trichomonas vaginalis G3]|eukprot:XP_001310530.1 ABC transporter family protein [Trichomonas vaginalis G3]
MGEKDDTNQALLLQDNPEEVKEIVEEITQKKSKYQKIPFLHKMYWFFYRKPKYFLVFIPSFVVGYTAIQSNLYAGKIIDSLLTDDPIPLIKKYSLYMFIMAITNSILNLVNNTFWNQIGSIINCKVKRVIFKKYMQSDVTYFDKTSIGDSLNLLNEDAGQVSSVFNFSKYTQLRNIGQLISSIIVGFTISAPITCFSLFITLFNAVILRAIKNYAVSNMRAKSKVNAKALTVALESMSNPRVIYSYNQEKNEYEKYYNIVSRSCHLERVSHGIFSLSFRGGHMLNQGTWSVVLSFDGFLILRNKISAGDLFAILRIVNLFSFLLGMLLATANREARSIEAADRIFELLENNESVDLTSGYEPSELKGNIEFRNVWFKYPTRDQWVLKNVSFKIKTGDIVAFVGHSGCGKSTIVQLLLRFYDVNEGSIFIDDVNIKEYSASFLHRNIGVVQQDSSLFTLSVRDNILYGKPDSSKEEVEKAAKIAFAHNFIMKLPQQYDSKVGEKGTTLSGGQRQRIAIARAVLKNPSVLITDEATAALDSVSEKKVEKALRAVMSERTSIIIAHRLGTIRCASHIFVFDDGELVEEGSHDELISKRGIYYELVKIQLNA